MTLTIPTNTGFRLGHPQAHRNEIKPRSRECGNAPAHKSESASESLMERWEQTPFIFKGGLE